MIPALVALVVLTVAFLVFTGRERDRHAAVLAEFSRAAFEREEGLLQRIQAPDTAVIQHYNEQQPPSAPPAVRTDDDADDDYWEKINGLSTAELADLAAEQEVTGG